MFASMKPAPKQGLRDPASHCSVLPACSLYVKAMSQFLILSTVAPAEAAIEFALSRLTLLLRQTLIEPPHQLRKQVRVVEILDGHHLQDTMPGVIHP